MANLVITVIAIALVAAAAMMGAYYGGSAFLTNRQAAQASSVTQVGLQISAAWQSFMADHSNSKPASWSDLVGGNYLKGIPLYPAGNSVAMGQFMLAPDDTGIYWAIADMGLPSTAALTDQELVACQKIEKAALGAATIPANPMPAFTYANLISSTYGSNGIYGCNAFTAGPASLLPGGTNSFPATGARGSGGHMIMFYKAG